MTDTHTHSAKQKYTCNIIFRLYFHKKSPIHIFKVCIWPHAKRNIESYWRRFEKHITWTFWLKSKFLRSVHTEAINHTPKS